MYCMNVVKSRPLLTPDGKEELLDGARHGISPLTALLPHNSSSPARSARASSEYRVSSQGASREARSCAESLAHVIHYWGHADDAGESVET